MFMPFLFVDICSEEKINDRREGGKRREEEILISTSRRMKRVFQTAGNLSLSLCFLSLRTLMKSSRNDLRHTIDEKLAFLFLSLPVFVLIVCVYI